MNTVAVPRRRRSVLLWLILTQLVVLVSLVPWIILAGFTFVALDTGARDTLGVWAMRIALWAYPLLPVACSALAWKAYRLGGTRRAVTLASVALVAAALLIAYVLWATSPV